MSGDAWKEGGIDATGKQKMQPLDTLFGPFGCLFQEMVSRE